MLLYIVLIGTAADLANTNVLYAIVCFAVMIPAEKFIKEMFGFKDKLGSPLGAMATGALGSQLLNRMKGGGGNSGNGNKNKDVQDTSPTPPTKDIEFSGEGSPEGLSDAEAGAVGAGAGAAAQEATNSNEQIGEDQISTAQGIRAAEEKADNDAEKIEETAKKEGLMDKYRNWADNTPGLRAVRLRRANKNLQKYGTNSIRGLAKARALKAGKWLRGKGAGAIRGTIRGATTLALGAGGALIGSMFGKGKEGAALGAGLGNKIGKGLGNTVTKVGTNVGQYAWTGFRDAAGNKFEHIDTNEQHAERQAKNAFLSNARNIQIARQNWQDRHGNEQMTAGDLDEELEKMYDMNIHGINESQYNDVLEQAAFLGNKDGDFEKAMIGAKQDYKQKDYLDEKAMKGAHENLVNNLKERFGEAKADTIAREILTAGAGMHGVNSSSIALPKKNYEYEVLPQYRNAAKLLQSLGVSSNPGNDKLKQVEEIRVALKDDGGYTPNEMRKIAQQIDLGHSNVKLETVREIYVDKITDNSKKKATLKAFQDELGKNNMSNEELRQEIVEREEVKKVFDLTNSPKDYKKVVGIRKEEVKSKNGTKFRELAAKNQKGDFSKNDKDALSQNALKGIEGYQRILEKK